MSGVSMSDNNPAKRGLGRGLSALMADVAADQAAARGRPGGGEQIVPIEKLKPNPNQPRRRFNREELEELAESIREKGVLQPLIVRENPDIPDTYQIVAGERRWRAAQLVRQHEVPVLVREYDDDEVLEIAIIENVQREDLNPIDEAAGYRQLMDRFGHTQEKVATALGKSRSHVANMLRLLQLPDAVQSLLREERISAGHARALLMADDPVALAGRVLREGLSVRETEKLVRDGATEKRQRKSRETPAKDADTKALEADLSANIGLKVQINHKAGGQSGQVSIAYRSLEELDDICRILSSADANPTGEI